MKILVIDDDESVRTLLAKTLTSYAYTVEVVTEGETGLDRATTHKYDLIIANIALPKLDGINLCRQLRARGDRVPVLLFAESAASANLISGLDAGADDYVIQPFDLVALMARVRALLRRKHLALIPAEITWGELSLNPTSAEVTYRGHLLSLTPKEYGLLELLLQNPQRVFSRSIMLDRIWSSEASPIEGTVTNHIKELRQKLKAAGMTVDIIETVYGLGYRLKSPPQQILFTPPEKALKRQPADSGANQLAKVMIVDDDQTTLEALTYLLRPWGLQIISLSHPERFWEVLRSAIPDLLILNLEMLTFSSLELCQKVRQDSTWGDLLILAMTTHTDAESVQKIFAIGVDDFVSKPIVGPELVTRVVSRLERRRYQNPLKIQPGALPGVTFRPLTEMPGKNFTGDAATLQPSTVTTHVNLLLVDDHPDNLRVLSAILDGQGYKVRKAISGEIALDAIATLPPDLILLDIKMPEMNGYEVCATLKASEKTRPIPVIFLSALDDTADKMKAFAVGGVDYITKPFRAEEVLARIKHQLIMRQQQRQLAEQNRQIQQARDTLQESEAQFRDAFDRLTIGIGLIGLDNRWLKVNPALCQLLGYSEFELLSTLVTDRIHPVDGGQWQQHLQALLSHETPHGPVELRWCCEDNLIMRVATNTSLVCDGANQPLYLVTQMQAIADC